MSNPSETDLCQARVEFMGQTLFCDRLVGHDGRHGGIFAGCSEEEDWQTIDVEVQW